MVESAGPCLPRHAGGLQDREPVFAARIGEVIAGLCTLTKTDLAPSALHTPPVGFMFVGEPFRGNRLSWRLISVALRYASVAPPIPLFPYLKASME